MTDSDPAFLWETAALRGSPQRVAEAEVDNVESSSSPGRWVTLREASRATGIPVETLRKWARRSTIPTYLEPTQMGTNIRLVDLDGVEERAAELGRTVGPAAEAYEGETPPTPKSDGTTSDAAPPGTMIVPIDAWNKMLNQLGNLHEAGQQLAAARERAAKAETEARFLRERLAEIRLETGTRPAPPEQAAASAEEPQEHAVAATPDGPPPEKVWHYLVRRVRARTGRERASG
ncbi:MAG: hypothetical protein QNJ77_00640 [Acidimicrobiia bacterium]|nr:hypothetical protein [Acidimicrobiia bacterium]